MIGVGQAIMYEFDLYTPCKKKKDEKYNFDRSLCDGRIFSLLTCY